MDVRHAILSTARLFERRPEAFNFCVCRVPECGAPGCAIGYILAFLGFGPGDALSQHCEGVLGVSDWVFYQRMNALKGRRDWTYSAAECARCLRLYADEYFPAAPSAIPSDIRALFEVETA